MPQKPYSRVLWYKASAAMGPVIPRGAHNAHVNLDFNLDLGSCKDSVKAELHCGTVGRTVQLDWTL